MAQYKPALPFRTPVYILKPSLVTSKGVTKKVIPEATDEDLIFCSFKSYGGTESTTNDILTVFDTVNIETWYDPRITSDCVIQTVDGKQYDVIGTPENINMENQFIKFKVEAVGGGA